MVSGSDAGLKSLKSQRFGEIHGSSPSIPSCEGSFGTHSWEPGFWNSQPTWGHPTVARSTNSRDSVSARPRTPFRFGGRVVGAFASRSAMKLVLRAETSFGTRFPVDNGGEEVRASAGTLWRGQGHPPAQRGCNAGAPAPSGMDGRTQKRGEYKVSAKTQKK